MPIGTGPEFLTLREAAATLRLSQRALYDLARRRALPSALIGGKWLFPRAALARWAMREALAGVPGDTNEDGPRAPPPPVIAGSQDPLLDWAVRQAGGDLALGGGGSLAGLEALAAGRALAAAVHLPDPEGGPPNEAAAREVLADTPEGALGLCWARREQGLIVAPGNPLGLARVADLARPGLRVAGRQPRAGSHLLLVHLLSEAGVRLSALDLLPDPALDEDEVAAAVAEGRAGAGFGVRAAATARGLGFVPAAWERFDLVARPRDPFRPPLRDLLALARTEAFRARAARLGGYDLSGSGEVVFVV